MLTHSTYQLRGYCNRRGYERLADALTLTRRLYNAALEHRIAAYRQGRTTVGRYDQLKELTAVRADHAEYGNLAVGVCRAPIFRLQQAFQAFFRRVNAGETPGFPRFKPASRWRTLEVAGPSPYMVKTSPDGKRAYVRVKGLPVITLRTKRPLPPSEQLKSLRIIQRPTGVTVDLTYAVAREPLPMNPSAVGIDAGVTDRLALSTGERIGRRRIDNSRVARLQQAVSRSQKGGNRRRKRVFTLRRAQRQEQVRNRNECHRITTDLVRRFGLIAVERLNIGNMTHSAAGTVDQPGVNVAAKSGLNRSILEQTWGLLREQLRCKAEWAGRQYVAVEPSFTSQECSRCGRRDGGARRGKEYHCGGCGFAGDADVNAAVNILRRGMKQGGNTPAAPAGAMTTARLPSG